jgi:hypothetical protein
MVSSGQDGFQPLGKFAPFHENPVPAALALDADIGSQPNDLPFPASAGMRFPKLEDVSQGKIGKHTVIITIPGPVYWIPPW